jgi:DNA-binding NarL/FixJ family response regulator
VIRVLLADDDALLRAGLRTILEPEPDILVVGVAADGEEAVTAAGDLQPDIVLMDVRMPRLDGLEATRRIVQGKGPGQGPRVIVLTTFDLDEYVYDALRAGASGFLLKNADPDDLVTAIRIVHEGHALLAPSVTQRVVEEFTRRSPRLEARPELDELTPRELEVLGLMARGLSNAEIARELILGEATVRTHVGRILMKLRLRDRVQAVVLAYESGFVVPGQQPRADPA